MSGPNESGTGVDTDEFRSARSTSVSEHSETPSSHSETSRDHNVVAADVARTVQDPPLEEAQDKGRTFGSAIGVAEVPGKKRGCQAEEGEFYDRHSGEPTHSSARLPARRESRLDYGFKLPDGRYRPPETEEEWNAFYQEYTSGGAVNHPERFLIVTPTDAESKSPLFGPPMEQSAPRMSDVTKEQEYGSTSGSGRHGSFGQLASAFIKPRPSFSRQYAGTGTSRRSADSSYAGLSRVPLEHQNSQDLPNFAPAAGEPSPGLYSPMTETPKSHTPLPQNNQDPEIPNMEFGQFNGDRSRYQSGMNVSSSRRATDTQAETPQTWASPASHEQRDLARLLGQSSAKLLDSTSPEASVTPDTDTEEEHDLPSVTSIEQRLTDLPALGAEESRWKKERSDTLTPSTELGSRMSLLGPESESTIRADGRKLPDTNSSQSGEALQTIPRAAGSGGETASPLTIPSSSNIRTSIDSLQSQTRTGTAGAVFLPAESAPPSPMLHRESNPTAFKASLPQLLEEESSEAGASVFTNTKPFDITPEVPRHRSSFVAKDGPIHRVVHDSTSRKRLDSEVSEDGRRYDVTARQSSEALRLKTVWEQKGHLTAPKQAPSDVRRRLKAIWKLGLDRPGEEIHRAALDRYVRLAKAICETKMAMITILAEDSQICPSRIGIDIMEAEYDVGICTHTALSAEKCMTVPDAQNDWRFHNHPWISSGKIRAYCGAPLIMNFGRTKVTIGSLCVVDDRPRPDFNEDVELALQDLAACIGGELELLYVHEDQKFQQIMHETSVQFLRDCLQVQQIPGGNRKRKGKSSVANPEDEAGNYGIIHLNNKSESGKVNLYNETCRIIGETLNTTACLVLDTTCFHVFYPTSADKSSTHGSKREPTGESRTTGTGTRSSAMSSRSSHLMTSRAQTGRADEKRARNMQYEDIDRHHPQVRFLPGKRRRNEQQVQIDALHKVGSSAEATRKKNDATETSDVLTQIPVLGYWAEAENITFDFDSRSAKDALTAFISTNLQGRRYWFERDDSEGLADSINAIMPASTSTSLSMPIFDYRGQCSFIFIACWGDLYYSYDQSILAFVETMCGTLLASTLRNRLSAVDEAQRAFARMANHELKTPMHQMSNYIEEMLCLLEESKEQHTAVPMEVLQELEKYASGAQTSSRRMGHLLDAVTSYLEIGGEFGEKRGQDVDDMVLNVDDLLTAAMEDARRRETKNRQLAGDNTMGDVEMMVEIVPRETGTWLLTRDVNPLQNAIHQLLLNACQATRTGYISLVCEDISRKENVPDGYEASLPTSIISIRIQDTGNGMPQDFADDKIFQPYTKWDQNTPGAGLGVTLAHRTIDLVGGTLAFQTDPSAGTLAIVEVPLKIKNEDVSSDSHEHHFRPVECKICLLGFDNRSNRGVQQAGITLKSQIKAIGVALGNIDDSDIVVIEGGYDIRECVSEIKHAAGQRALRLIRLGHPTMCNAPDRERYLNGDLSLPVEWLFRPVYPRLLRRIAMIPSDEIGRDLLHQHDIAHNERDASSHLRWAEQFLGAPEPIRSLDFAEDERGEDRHKSVARDQSPSRPIHLSRRSSNETSIKINARDLKVLVAEDDMINRKLLCGKLAKMKVPSLQAENGQVAVDVYKQCLPRIVLMDIEMPVRTGFEASMRIRAYEKEANLPPCLIWAVTAKSDDVSKVYGMETCGIDLWLTKPLRLSKLEDLIRAKFDIMV